MTSPETTTPGAGSWQVYCPAAAELAAAVRIPRGSGMLRKFIAFGGPGYMISVGYMDPGNWATDLGAGSGYGYALLSIVLVSSLMGMFLQMLSLRLGIVTGRDLAQMCRAAFPRWVAIGLWLFAEIGIAACDLAEVLGTAIALQLLFGLPLLPGVLLTALDALLVLGLQSRGFRSLESIVIGLIALIAVSFAYELWVSHPDTGALFAGFVPHAAMLRNHAELFLAVGIIGATVMPHNLYLHSALVQTRGFERSQRGKQEAIRFSTLDSTLALILAFGVNAAILILAAATFHKTGHTEIAEIQDAYALLTPLLGTSAAAIVFAVALLLSGQNATLTGTLAGQIVMEGFVALRLTPWLRRLVTRSIAILPAVFVIGIAGEHAAGNLLILSQVVLSLQLPFAMVPLILFTSSRQKMGPFVTSRWMAGLAWAVAAVIIGLNLILLGGIL